MRRHIWSGALAIGLLASLAPVGAQAAEAAPSAAPELSFERVVHRPALVKGLRDGADLLAFGPLLTQDGVNREITFTSDLRARSQSPLPVTGIASAELSGGRVAYLDNACNATGYSSCADIWIKKGNESTPSASRA